MEPLPPIPLEDGSPESFARPDKVYSDIGGFRKKLPTSLNELAPADIFDLFKQGHALRDEYMNTAGAKTEQVQLAAEMSADAYDALKTLMEKRGIGAAIPATLLSRTVNIIGQLRETQVEGSPSYTDHGAAVSNLRKIHLPLDKQGAISEIIPPSMPEAEMLKRWLSSEIEVQVILKQENLARDGLPAPDLNMAQKRLAALEEESKKRSNAVGWHLQEIDASLHALAAHLLSDWKPCQMFMKELRENTPGELPRLEIRARPRTVVQTGLMTISPRGEDHVPRPYSAIEVLNVIRTILSKTQTMNDPEHALHRIHEMTEEYIRKRTRIKKDTAPGGLGM